MSKRWTEMNWRFAVMQWPYLKCTICIWIVPRNHANIRIDRREIHSWRKKLTLTTIITGNLLWKRHFWHNFLGRLVSLPHCCSGLLKAAPSEWYHGLYMHGGNNYWAPSRSNDRPFYLHRLAAGDKIGKIVNQDTCFGGMCWHPFNTKRPVYGLFIDMCTRHTSSSRRMRRRSWSSFREEKIAQINSHKMVWLTFFSDVTLR